MTSAPLILIVGMHRSGTSLLGSILQQLGLALPGELIEADSHNPEGYYEAAAITALQEQLLQQLERWWPGPEGLRPLPAHWLRHPACQQSAAQLRELVQREQAQQLVPWAIKDPRTSLLLPLWRRVAADLRLPLKLVLAVRNPQEVVESLCQRDGVAAGMTPQRAERLWWHHNRQVLRDSQGLPVLCVDYSRWFTDQAAEQLQRLADFIGMPLNPGRQAACLACSRPEHRRSRARFVSPAVNHFYRQLQAGNLSAPPQPLPIRDDWRQRLGRCRPGQSITPNGWFDPDHYHLLYDDLPNELDLQLHYQQHGWREGRSPHPLFDPQHYTSLCYMRRIRLGNTPPLQHFLRHGLKLGLMPSPLIQVSWIQRQGITLQATEAPSLAQAHPWGAAALALHCGNASQAAILLHSWLERGILPAEAALLRHSEAPWLPWHQNHHPIAGRPSSPTTLKADHLRVQPLGLTLHDWPLHGWLDRISGIGPEKLQEALQTDRYGDVPSLLLSALPLELLSCDGHAREQLLAAAGQPQTVLLEANPKEQRAWQRLGLTCELLGSQRNGWLSAISQDAISAELGLPDPASLPKGVILCLGSAGDAWERNLDGAVWCIPGFDAIALNCWHRTRLLAAWLQRCCDTGLQLVRLGPNANERLASSWLSLECFEPPLLPQAVSSELAWRRAGQPASATPITPQPNHRCLLEHQTGEAPLAICISLFNYGDRITEALDSAAQQSLAKLELIVVDDASTDGGEQRVLHWMEQHRHRFQRLLLLQHKHNAGLAATRNTAFAASRAPWCFVLDADNCLLPEAAAHCLAVGERAPQQTAVVHPLVEVRSEGNHRDPRSLISGSAWQREQFAQGNVVDAMALIRRSAWEQCGGFRHIPGGWEDFDFWCCLIEAGFHGVLCPQRLAIYRSHSSSMISSQTDQRVREISRLLQQLHPWLELPMAQPNR